MCMRVCIHACTTTCMWSPKDNLQTWISPSTTGSVRPSDLAAPLSPSLLIGPQHELFDLFPQKKLLQKFLNYIYSSMSVYVCYCCCCCCCACVISLCVAVRWQLSGVRKSSAAATLCEASPGMPHPPVRDFLSVSLGCSPDNSSWSASNTRDTQ